MPGEDRKELIEDLRRIETKPGLDTEPDRDRSAQRAKNRIDPFWIAQQPAAGALAINHRRRTAQVEVHSRDWILLQLPSGAYEGWNIVPDQLCNRRTPGRIFGDGTKDRFFEIRSRMHSKIFGEIDI